MTTTPRKLKRPTPKRNTPTFETERGTLVSALADGLVLREIGALVGVTATTIYRWSKLPGVAEDVAAERKRRLEATSTIWLRHMSDAIEFAYAAATGKARVTNDYQMELLRAFIQLAAPVTTPDGQTGPARPDGLLHGPIQVNVIQAPAGELPPLGAVTIAESRIIED